MSHRFIPADQQLKPRMARSAASTGIRRATPAAQVRHRATHPKQLSPQRVMTAIVPITTRGPAKATAQDGCRGATDRPRLTLVLVMGSVRWSENHRRRCSPDPDDPSCGSQHSCGNARVLACHGHEGLACTRFAAFECDQIGPEERAYSRFFSQEQAIIAEMRMAAYLMLEGLGMIRGWLRNLHAAL